MPVPGLFELNDYGEPLYVNIGYAWRGHYKNNPPYPPTEHNYVGQYRRTFVIPDNWAGKPVYLCIGSATSNVRVWVNGHPVGYSEDSKLEARFDISKAVHTGTNSIAREIFRWCDGTYLEDQDFWRFTGIAREVYLYARPNAHIKDLTVNADYDVEKGLGSLYDFTVLTPKMIDKYVRDYLSLLDLRFVSLVVDRDDNIAGVGISMQSISRASRKAGGRIFPFGWFHLLKSMFLRYEESCELLLIGIAPEWQDKGVNALIFRDLITTFNKCGFKYAETNGELETNLKVQALWNLFDAEQTKRRRIYGKPL